MASAEPVEIHSLIQGGDVSTLQKTIVALREQAFPRRPVEKLRDKVHKAKDSSPEDDGRGRTATR